MKRYIALLRGINVGGKNKVPMPVLKKLFESKGYADVVTYINSGNILFSTDAEEAGLKQECEQLLAEAFSFSIPVTIVSARDLWEALDHAPPWWDRDGESKTQRHLRHPAGYSPAGHGRGGGGQA